MSSTETVTTPYSHSYIHHKAQTQTPAFFPGHKLAVLPGDALLVGFFIILLCQYRHRARRKAKAWRIMCRLIAQHQNTLAQRRQTCLTEDHYGVVRHERWDKECTYFCETILLPTLQEHHLGAFWPALQRRTLRRINRVTKTIIKRNKTALTAQQDKADTRTPAQFSASMDPLDYERFCAELLRKAGWNARATPPGSDQGVDILAERNGVHLVLQCKLYSRSVGNKAVQEIFTARQHRHAHYAAVVSNAGYTRPARQLANSTGVLLLHHSQLSTLTLADLKHSTDHAYG